MCTDGRVKTNFLLGCLGSDYCKGWDRKHFRSMSAFKEEAKLKPAIGALLDKEIAALIKASGSSTTKDEKQGSPFPSCFFLLTNSSYMRSCVPTSTLLTRISLNSPRMARACRLTSRW